VFDVCPKIHKKCAFCGNYKQNKQCGLMGGSIKASNIAYMVDCPKNMTKYQKTKYLKSIDG